MSFGYEIKNHFFDRDTVIRALDKVTYKALSKAAGFIRKTAQRSMRSRQGPSAPGTPPNAHGNRELREKLLYGYDPSTKSMLAGPAYYKRGEAPPLNEFGGSITRRNPRTGQRYTAKYPKRSFMAPALDKNIDLIPEQFRNSVKG